MCEKAVLNFFGKGIYTYIYTQQERYLIFNTTEVIMAKIYITHVFKKKITSTLSFILTVTESIRRYLQDLLVHNFDILNLYTF